MNISYPLRFCVIYFPLWAKACMQLFKVNKRLNTEMKDNMFVSLFVWNKQYSGLYLRKTTNRQITDLQNSKSSVLMETVICLASAGMRIPRIWAHHLIHTINSYHCGFVCISANRPNVDWVTCHCNQLRLGVMRMYILSGDSYLGITGTWQTNQKHPRDEALRRRKEGLISTDKSRISVLKRFPLRNHKWRRFIVSTHFSTHTTVSFDSGKKCSGIFSLLCGLGLTASC